MYKRQPFPLEHTTAGEKKKPVPERREEFGKIKVAPACFLLVDVYKRQVFGHDQELQREDDAHAHGQHQEEDELAEGGFLPHFPEKLQG